MKKRVSDYGSAILERDSLESIVKEWRPTALTASAERLEGLYEKQLASWLADLNRHRHRHSINAQQRG
jgi:hypothetical protein